MTTGLNAVAGKRREEFSPEPITYEDMRPGCYEPAERVADMDQGHVLSSLLFPSFPRYCGQVFHEAKDKELALACVRAWNDFILEDLAGDYPGRFIPMMIIPLWDPAAAVTEMQRTAALGAKSIAFSENPTKLGLPSIHTDYWDPVFRVRRRGRIGAVHARGLVVESDPDVRRHADARLHGLLGRGQPGGDAAGLALQREVRALPRAQDRPVGGLHRMDPLLPGAGRAGGRQAAVLGLALRHQHESQPRPR